MVSELYVKLSARVRLFFDDIRYVRMLLATYFTSTLPTGQWGRP